MFVHSVAVAAVILLGIACNGSAGSVDAGLGDAAAKDGTLADLDAAPGDGHVDGPGPMDIGQPDQTYPAPLVIQGAPGNDGVYDPSLCDDPDGKRVWLSYTSANRQAVQGKNMHFFETRLALSADHGASWLDQQLAFNKSEAEADPPSEYAGHPAIWVNEVSSLTYDPGAPQPARWKLVWQKYLKVEDGTTEIRKFEYSWLAFKTAATVDGLVGASEHKLLVGKLYDAAGNVQYKDARGGPPELRISELNSSLADCLVLTEPGLAATADSLYLVLSCGYKPTAAAAAKMRVVLLRYSNPAGPWTYVGTIFDAAAAAAVDPSYLGYTAADLVLRGSEAYLVVSPMIVPTGTIGPYHGCDVFRFENLATAALADVDLDGKPDRLQTVRMLQGGINNGACGYSSGSTASGLIFGEIFPVAPPYARLFKSGSNIP
jgi:hypothetical protein